eukprot:1128102-Heterocapsa_arctica.AAC.1
MSGNSVKAFTSGSNQKEAKGFSPGSSGFSKVAVQFCESRSPAARIAWQKFADRTAMRVPRSASRCWLAEFDGRPSR